jgi:hypothetical protein
VLALDRNEELLQLDQAGCEPDALVADQVDADLSERGRSR